MKLYESGARIAGRKWWARIRLKQKRSPNASGVAEQARRLGIGDALQFEILLPAVQPGDAQEATGR